MFVGGLNQAGTVCQLKPDQETGWDQSQLWEFKRARLNQTESQLDKPALGWGLTQDIGTTPHNDAGKLCQYVLQQTLLADTPTQQLLLISVLL